jgi:hypothetical protein
MQQTKQNQRTGVRMVTAAAAAALLITSACARQAVSSEMSLPGAAVTPSLGAAPPGTVGGATGRGAVEAFMGAVKAQDLQAMSGLWGNEKGLARDQYKRDDLEKRLVIMQCLLQHDAFRFVEAGPRLQTGGRQEHLVELRKGKLTAQTTVTTVPGANGRQLVEDIDVTKLRDFCS